MQQFVEPCGQLAEKRKGALKKPRDFENLDGTANGWMRSYLPDLEWFRAALFNMSFIGNDNPRLPDAMFNISFR